MMLLVAPPFFKVASGFVAPSRTLTTKDFYSVLYRGYIRPGGAYAGLLGDSGGTLSGTMLTGQTTDAVLQSTDGWGISLGFVGNTVAALAGCTGMKVNSTVCPISISAIYDGDSGLTGMGFDGSAIHLAASTSYTVQLV
ncbi:MAG: hypothetical protein WA975_03475 [Mesorhizobium sp.]